MVYRSRVNRDEGVALITVLGLLVVFLLLGMAWVNYMALEQQNSKLGADELRTRYAATGGANAAIAEIRVALASGAPVDLTTTRELDIPLYHGGAKDDELPVAVDNQRFHVAVRVSDESARININYAPPNVLRKILGISGEKARQIRSSLPRVEGGVQAETAEGHRSWFTSVDELVTRGLVDRAALTPDLKRDLTVYTVPDPAHPTAYMNVNSAPAPVLEALLDIPPDVADRVIAVRAERPFGDVTDLSAAAGKDPATFSVRPEPDALKTLPADLSFSSRCFRISSTAQLKKSMEGMGDILVDTEHVEAVVFIEEDGSPKIMYWSESAPQDVSDAAPGATPEETPA